MRQSMMLAAGVLAASAAALAGCGTAGGGVAAGPAAGTQAAVAAPRARAVGAPAERLIARPDAATPFVAFAIWVQAGSQNDPEGKEGLAALTASMVAEGATRQATYEQIQEQLYPMAAGYGWGADKEMTVIRGRVHRDNLEPYYALLRNAVLEPAFTQTDFDRLKARTLNALERSRRYARDEELSKELLFREAYRGTRYEHPVDGYVASVRALTLADVREFYGRHYLRDNVVVALGGGYPAGFPERVRAELDRLPPGRLTQPPRPEPRMPDGVRVVIVEKETDATAISLGFPLQLLRGDEDFVPLMVANSWLGEHRNSFGRLYQAIRETRGMNYGDYSYIEAFPAGYATLVPRVNVPRRSQLFELWIRPIAMTAPGNLHDRSLFATRAAWYELQRLVEAGLPAAEVERTVDFLRYYHVNWANTVARQLGYAVDDAFYGIPAPGFLASMRPELDRVTPARVNAAIRRHLQAENMYVVFITQDAEGLKRKLLSGAATPITYAGDRPQAVLAEDRIIASLPIPVREQDITIIPIDQVLER
jgi:zinc protease